MFGSGASYQVAWPVSLWPVDCLCRRRRGLTHLAGADEDEDFGLAVVVVDFFGFGLAVVVVVRRFLAVVAVEAAEEPVAADDRTDARRGHRGRGSRRAERDDGRRRLVARCRTAGARRRPVCDQSQ